MAAILGCVLFIAVSLWLATTGPVGLVIGVVGAATFGFFGAVWAALGLRPGPGLVIDDHGFDDRSSAVAVGRVPWSDVVSVEATEVAGVASVVVRVHDPEAYVERVPWYVRTAARANIGMVGSSVTLSSVGLRTTPEQLLAALVEAHDRYVQRTS